MNEDKAGVIQRLRNAIGDLSTAVDRLDAEEPEDSVAVAVAFLVVSERADRLADMVIGCLQIMAESIKAVNELA
jgi:hypothetical protein